MMTGAKRPLRTNTGKPPPRADLLIAAVCRPEEIALKQAETKSPAFSNAGLLSVPGL
jgi:hypothetical protein